VLAVDAGDGGGELLKIVVRTLQFGCCKCYFGGLEFACEVLCLRTSSRKVRTSAFEIRATCESSCRSVNMV
jgi:hypothetical protein